MHWFLNAAALMLMETHEMTGIYHTFWNDSSSSADDDSLAGAGMVEITSPAITAILTRYACDPHARKCVPNQQGEFDDQYSCRLSAGDSPGSTCEP